MLDVKSWYIILDTMQKIENVIRMKLKQKGGKISQNKNNQVVATTQN